MTQGNRPEPGSGDLADYYDSSATDLLARWDRVAEWLQTRQNAGLLPHYKVNSHRPYHRAQGLDSAGRHLSGINFANQDCLNLSAHPTVIAAIQSAAQRFGVHAAGPAAQMGLTEATVALETAIAEFTACTVAVVFPSGWDAAFGTIRALVRPGDRVLIDQLAHPGLQDGARTATSLVTPFPHLATEGLGHTLAKLRQDAPADGILVVTEGLFGLDSTIPDLPALQAMCRQYEATLLVDVAHDLGVLGPTGRGLPELQGMLGEIDVLVGAFSKCFAANGGFAASGQPSLRAALRFDAGPQMVSTAMAPMQAAAVLAALDLSTTPEGRRRRERLMHNVWRLRSRLAAAGFEVLGVPSAIVPVQLGESQLSRRMTAAVLELGGIVNLVEGPLVADNASRWMLQVMSDHTEQDISDFVLAAIRARDLAHSSDWNPRAARSGPDTGAVIWRGS